MVKPRKIPAAEIARGRIRVHVALTHDFTLVFLTPNRAQRASLASLSADWAKGEVENLAETAFGVVEDVLLDCLVEWRETQDGKPIAPPTDMRAALRESGTLWGVQGQAILTRLFLCLEGLGSGAPGGAAPGPAGHRDSAGTEEGRGPDLP